MKTHLHKLLFLLLLSLLIGSCKNPFFPELSDASDPVVSNRTPRELLNNLQIAYSEKNINLFRDLLDKKKYRFELIASEVGQIGMDVNGDGLRDAWWGYEQEVELTNRMFNYGSSNGEYPPPDKITLQLHIPPEENWQIDPEVGHEDWLIVPCGFNLILSYDASYSSFTASGTARFYLRSENDRWYIVIWRDESNL